MLQIKLRRWDAEICVLPSVLAAMLCQAVERGCKKPKFSKKPENQKCPKFRFFSFFKRKTLKTHILNSQSQQKIVAFQSY